jgi:hypothetical protein
MMRRMSLIPLLMVIGPLAWAQDEPASPPVESAQDRSPFVGVSDEPGQGEEPEHVEHVEAPPGAPGGDPAGGQIPGEGEPTAAASPGGTAVPVGGDQNLLVVLVDDDQTYDGRRITFNLGKGDDAVSVTLADDGEAPDLDADDGRSVALVAVLTADAARASLTLDDGEVIWTQAALSVPAGMRQRSMRLEVGPQGITGGLTVDKNSRPASVADGPPQSLFVSLVTSLMPPMAMGLVGGLLLGLVAPLLRRKRALEPGLAARAPVSWPPGLGLPDPGEAVCWQVPDEAARTRLLAAVARRAAAAGPVLIAPHPSARSALAAALAGLPPVLVPARDGASPGALAQAAWGLGGGLLLVAGPAAVEAPEAGEGDDAPLDELIELSPISVVLVVLPGEASPLATAARLIHAADGLAMGEQLVLSGSRLVTAAL